MKIPWKKILAAFLLAVLGAAAAGAYWLFWTTGGAAWAVRAAARRAPVPVGVGGVSGRLLGSLRLTAVTVEWPSGTASVEIVAYRLRPLSLLRGAVSFPSVEAAGVTVALRGETGEPPAPSPPPEFRWPVATGVPAWLDVEIESLRLSRVRVDAPGRDPFLLDDLSAAAAWRDGAVRIRDLGATLPGARLEGSLAAGFSRPSFSAELVARLEDSRQGTVILSLAADLGPSPSPGGLAGPVALSADFADSPEVRIEGEASLEKNRASLRGISVSLPGQAGVVTGRAEAVFSADAVSALVHLSVHGLDLAAWTDAHTEISGDFRLSGRPDAYDGGFSLENPGRGVLGIRLQGKIAGGLRRLSVSRLRGEWLGGDLSGNFSLSREDGFRLEGSLEGRNLDPERIDPGWPGRIRFVLRGSARKKGSSPLLARIEGRLLDSTLRGRALSGEVAARLDEGGLLVSRLELHGDGFDISARGRLAERLEFSADIARLSGLLPGTEGKVRAEGWARWREGPAGGAVTARGEGVVLRGVRAQSFSASAAWEGKDRPFTVDAKALGLAADGVRFDSAALRAGGTPAEHDLRVSLRWGTGEIEGSARGGYRAGTWEGTVAPLTGRGDTAGSWSLEEPATVAVSAKAVRISRFRAAGAGGKTLRAEVDLTREPLRGSVDAVWDNVDPALADPWLKGISLSGTSSGHARLRWPAGGAPSVEFRISASGRIRRGERDIAVDAAEADARWDSKGLSARWEIGMGESGALSGNASSRQPARPGFPEEGEARGEWRSVDLSLLSPWISAVQVEGESSGQLRAGWRKDGRVALSGRAGLSGTVVRGDRRIPVDNASVEVDGDEGGTRATFSAVLGGGTRITGSFRSTLPARIGIPEAGALDASWESLDLALVSPWLPQGMTAAGTVSGRVNGELRTGGTFEVRGEAGVRDGTIGWRGRGKEIEAKVRSADLSWSWKDDAARGDFSLSLEEHGQARGTFRLPVPARFPIAARPQGEVSGTLSATFREKGTIPAFFPGMIQESSGTITVEMTAGGTWQSPDLSGRASLAGAGAYLPPAGIRLRDLEAKATISGRTIRVDSLKVRSGEGTIEGTAAIFLSGWSLDRYEATLKGENFQAAELPEFRLSASPDLSIEGTKERLKVRGQVSVPYLLVYGRQTPPPVRRSGDVVIVGKGAAAEKESPLALDVEVKIVLGKHVLVKAEGIDARLEGSLTIRAKGGTDFTAQGEIRVAEGGYAAYGVRLKVTRGRLLFAGGPVERPTLDILATRKVGDVTAGVQVSGTPRRPLVKLYSEPPMPDTETLSYIVLGHPLGEERGQGDALMLAANALLPMTQSAVLRDRLQRRFGVDVLEVKTGEAEEAGTAVTVGKYLNPRLYVSYGRSLFTGANEVTMRYDFLKRFQVETSFGEESGVDLFYKIEFR
ncbi:MAG TPA: translocation/assembly module TamB domain-containing protein [Candidatus Aquicultoraceae bacterium]|nr:translocation/assembly module TamB domain-containing protein [Candidatus Aquicultoraceae bacterium]